VINHTLRGCHLSAVNHVGAVKAGVECRDTSLRSGGGVGNFIATQTQLFPVLRVLGSRLCSSERAPDSCQVQIDPAARGGLLFE